MKLMPRQVEPCHPGVVGAFVTGRDTDQSGSYFLTTMGHLLEEVRRFAETVRTSHQGVAYYTAGDEHHEDDETNLMQGGGGNQMAWRRKKENPTMDHKLMQQVCKEREKLSWHKGGGRGKVASHAAGRFSCI